MSADKFTVYILKFPNKKVYIGQTKNLKIRWEANGNHYNGNKEMYNDILKYGWINIKKEILLETDIREIAYDYEIKYIKQYNSTNPKFGYNKSTGGKFPTSGIKRNHSYASRKKMSDKKKGKHYSLQTEFPKKRVICIETKVIYDSLAEAERETKINHSHISQVCNKKRKTTGGYHWEYVG